MKNKTVVILASSRSFGNTRKIVNAFSLLKENIDIIDLNNYDIGYYDYEFKNANDDFVKVIHQVLKYETIVFATPIYWYSMSAQLKTFFDRISDLLHGEHKSIGRQLRGKQMGVISCGSDNEIFNGFEMPFRESAKYLGMTYIGYSHTWIKPDMSISNEVVESLKKLIVKLA